MAERAQSTTRVPLRRSLGPASRLEESRAALAGAPAGGGDLIQSVELDVSIVSNSLLLRQGLPLLLASSTHLRVVGSYSGVTVPVVAMPNPPWHVVLLDGTMGLDAAILWTRYWRTQEPPAYVVVIELGGEVETILACIEAGASAYTLRGASPEEVADVARYARLGLARCSPEVTTQLFARLASYSAAHEPLMELGAALTPRELEVLRLIAQDCSNQEIARALTIELHTVKRHVHNILDKLQLRDRWDAARVASERGWLEGRTVALTQRTRRPRHVEASAQ